MGSDWSPASLAGAPPAETVPPIHARWDMHPKPTGWMIAHRVDCNQPWTLGTCPICLDGREGPAPARLVEPRMDMLVWQGYNAHKQINKQKGRCIRVKSASKQLLTSTTSCHLDSWKGMFGEELLFCSEANAN